MDIRITMRRVFAVSGAWLVAVAVLVLLTAGPVVAADNSTENASGNGSFDNGTFENGSGDVDLSIGQMVSSTIHMHRAEFESDLENEEFEIDVESEGEEAVTRRIEELRNRTEELRQEKEQLQEAMRNGSIDRRNYVLRHAEIQAQIQNLKRSIAKVRSLNKVQGGEREVERINSTIGNMTGAASKSLPYAVLGRGQVKVEISNGALELKVERDGDEFFERDLPAGFDGNGSVISPDNATEIALNQFGDNWTVSKLELDHGRYEIELRARGGEGEIKIDAGTGTVLEMGQKQRERESEGREEEFERVPVNVSHGEAVDAAVEALGGNWTVQKLELDDGQYEIKLFREAANERAKVEVSAGDGTVEGVERKGPDEKDDNEERGRDEEDRGNSSVNDNPVRGDGENGNQGFEDDEEED